MEDALSFPPIIRRIARWLLYVVFALVWLMDLTEPHTVEVVALTGPAAALLMIFGRRIPLVVRGVVLGGCSWLLTIALAVGQSYGGTWGMLETAVLLWLLGLLVRQVENVRLATVLGGLVGSAAILMPIRVFDVRDQLLSSSFGFLLTLVAAVVVGIASYLRAMDSRRTRAVETVRHNERLELARDLHDFVAHHVTGIVVQAQAARTVGTTSPEEVEPLLRNIETAGTEALASMRRLVQVLREDGGKRVRPEEGFAELAALAENFSRTGPHVWLQISQEAREVQLAPEVTTSTHRVVQEALTNVTRHAPGTLSVAVRVWADIGAIVVSVVNEPPPHGHGRHTPPGGHGGFGLVGLRERIEAVGGELRAGPLPFGGWEVAAKLPVLASRARV